MNPSRKFAVAAIVVIAAVACLALSRWIPLADTVAPEKPGSIAWQQGAPTDTVTDSEEIFKRAFWRRPGNDDHIQHAERHEWRDAAGLERWQWFLVVSASPELIKYLRDDNAFGLVQASTAPVVSEAPNWFRFKSEDFTVMRASHGGMRLMFSKSDNTLYATDSGRGFTKGAPEPLPTAQGAQTPGRIPSSPPPKLKP
ncbi:MAG: hypothetical protein ACK528_06770 [Alphaproteobacteria bacterium]